MRAQNLLRNVHFVFILLFLQFCIPSLSRSTHFKWVNSSSSLISYSTLMNTTNDYYILPFYHGVCFFSGCITFILVERYRERKLSMVSTKKSYIAYTGE